MITSRQNIAGAKRLER